MKRRSDVTELDARYGMVALEQRRGRGRNNVHANMFRSIAKRRSVEVSDCRYHHSIALCTISEN